MWKAYKACAAEHYGQENLVIYASTTFWFWPNRLHQCPSIHMYVCLFMLEDLKCLTKLKSKVYTNIIVLIWFGNPCYNQLAVVKIGYSLTSVLCPDVQLFFKFSADQLWYSSDRRFRYQKTLRWKGTARKFMWPLASEGNPPLVTTQILLVWPQ